MSFRFWRKIHKIEIFGHVLLFPEKEIDCKDQVCTALEGEAVLLFGERERDYSMEIIAKKAEGDDVSEFYSEIDDDDDDNDADVEYELSPMLTSKISLRDENELLKADLSSLKKEVNRLRERESLSRIQARKQLPASLRQIAASSSRRRQRQGLQPQRKSSGDPSNDYVNGVGTMEIPDLEMHESGRGLFHRKQQHSPLGRDSILKLSQPKQKQMPFFPDDDTDREMEDEDESTAFLLAETSRMTEDDDDVVLPDSFWAMVQDRAGWLVGLLILQSMSSFILARNERLLQEHVIIVRFLTMLVGAGGNAGNQASGRGT
jgi:hypothetical protein